jgi:acyl transferase domain-containing protein
VCVAVVNSPRSVTLSGEAKTIDELQQLLSKFHPDVFKAQLRIENAFHSHQMDRFGVQEEILSTLGDIPGLPLQDTSQMFDARCAQARLYSSVTGGLVDERTPLDAHHWWSNVRQCVRFADAIQAIVRDDAIDGFLEISPHPVLSTSIRECCEVMAAPLISILPTLKRKEDEQMTLLMSLAQLSYAPDVWQHYLASRSVQPNKDEEHRFDTFPLYTFNMSSCWYESKESAIERRAYRRALHPLLGVRQWT